MGSKHNIGFTLIELSIVLVIIGLIVGGVLVGKDLISVASIRAQIGQIEKYNTAVNTFRGKFGYLPGDIAEPAASGIGLMPRGAARGQGDGNGVIEGNTNSACWVPGACADNGELSMFWSDLSYAHGGNLNLIEGTFSAAEATILGALGSDAQGDNIAKYLPAAKIGQGNYVYVMSGGPGAGTAGNQQDLTISGINYFGVAVVSSMGHNGTQSNPGMSVMQAYNIDTKIDDGLPISGAVRTYLAKASNISLPTIMYSQTPGSATTCYDNNNINFGTFYYSISQNSGSGINCALAFRFQ